tara:strand:- start:1794 stop:2201 length:408 start_codon:yes stop_codon:yes gene_type:complete
MTQEHTIRQAYINTLLDGGFTRLADKTINPTEGYIVGGVVEPTTMGLPGVSLFTFTVAEMYDEFKELWHKYDMLLHEREASADGAGVGIGTWIHKEQIYFDLVNNIQDLNIATRMAKRRGEVAIYDCKNQKDILL